MLDVVFMGTAPFAVPCLQAVVAAGYRVRAVVAQPDRPHGRGMKLQAPPVKEAALALGLPVLQPEKASDPKFVAELAEQRPQVIVVVAYGQILRPAVLEIPPMGCLNVHGSLLPELRGAAPIQWAIIRGYTETGVTTMFMDPGMDTGDMILKAKLPILPEDTAGTLAERLAPLGAKLLVETLSGVGAHAAPRIPQDHAQATYAPMLRREHGAVDWTRSAVEIRNQIHGCNPAPGAHARRHGETVKLWRAEVVPGRPELAPGTVVDPSSLVIQTGKEALRLLDVQPPNRARTDGAAFCRGYRVGVGEQWDPGLTE